MASIVKKSDIIGVSVGSVAFCMIGTLLLLAGAVFSMVRSTELVNALLGRDATIALVQASQESVLTRVDQALGNDMLGRTTVFFLWMFVGLAVYALIAGIVRATHQVRSVGQQMRMVNRDKANFSRLIIRELMLRTGIAIAWVIFALLCINLLLPFFFAAVAVAFGETVQPADWFMVVGGLAIVLLALHVQVVLARFFFGRVRLFTI